jgi:hypothetical protein
VETPAIYSTHEGPPWAVPLARVRDLVIHQVTHSGRRLRLVVEDLHAQRVHVFTFTEIWAYRFNVGHNCRRVGTAFELQESPWMSEHVNAPMRTARVDGLRHFVFGCVEGDFEVLAILPPEYGSE